jgi:hypothetical protein
MIHGIKLSVFLLLLSGFRSWADVGDYCGHVEKVGDSFIVSVLNEGTYSIQGTSHMSLAELEIAVAADPKKCIRAWPDRSNPRVLLLLDVLPFREGR